ncbi:MAG TPA: VanZ family protein, partial [Phototrophicaceae bacterium]|nr:VanZ family protein [Phototrophicaceae bacterium]
RRALSVAFITCCVYGAITELLQRLVPDRESSLGDFAVDCIISGLAALVIYGWANRRLHSEQRFFLPHRN